MHPPEFDPIRPSYSTLIPQGKITRTRSAEFTITMRSQDRHIRFLTNNFDLPAPIICLLYKSRWQVELFFES